MAIGASRRLIASASRPFRLGRSRDDCEFEIAGRNLFGENAAVAFDDPDGDIRMGVHEWRESPHQNAPADRGHEPDPDVADQAAAEAGQDVMGAFVEAEDLDSLAVVDVRRRGRGDARRLAPGKEAHAEEILKFSDMFGYARLCGRLPDGRSGEGEFLIDGRKQPHVVDRGFHARQSARRFDIGDRKPRMSAIGSSRRTTRLRPRGAPVPPAGAVGALCLPTAASRCPSPMAHPFRKAGRTPSPGGAFRRIALEHSKLETSIGRRSMPAGGKNGKTLSDVCG